MGDLGEIGTIVEALPNSGITLIEVVTPATVVGGTETFTVDLSKYGCTNIKGVLGFDETTTGQVVVQNTCTTAVSSSVLTVTPVTANTCVHSYYIWAY